MSTFFANRQLAVAAGLLGLALLLTGCFDETRPTFDEDLLQFETDIGSTQVERTVTLGINQEEAFDEFIAIQLSGRTQESAINVAIALSEATTAVEGEHFELLDQEVTIPAGEHFQDLEVRIYPDNFEPGEAVDIVPRITEDSDLSVMVNYSEYTLTVEKEE